MPIFAPRRARQTEYAAGYHERMKEGAGACEVAPKMSLRQTNRLPEISVNLLGNLLSNLLTSAEVMGLVDLHSNRVLPGFGKITPEFVEASGSHVYFGISEIPDFLKAFGYMSWRSKKPPMISLRGGGQIPKIYLFAKFGWQSEIIYETHLRHNGTILRALCIIHTTH